MLKKLVANRGFSLVLLSAALLVAIPGVSSAQMATSEGDTLVLTWEKTWNLALEKNETLQISRNNALIAQQRVNEAYSSAMPSVSLNGYFNHYFEVPQTIFTLPAAMTGTGSPLRIKTAFVSENNSGADISLTQPLWLAGKIGLGLNAAKTYREMSGYQVEVSREDLKVQVVQIFYGCMIADQGLVVSKEALQQVKNLYQQVQDMYSAGVASEYDLIRAKVAVSNQKPAVFQMEAQRDLTYKALKNVLGLDVNQPIRLEGQLEAEAVGPEYDFRTASAMAMNNRVELRQLELQERLYEIQYKASARSWLWPNFLAQASWETSAQAQDMKIGKYEYLSGWSGTLVLQIPIFDGLASHWQAQQAKVNMRNAKLQKAQLTRGIELQVFEALRSYDQASQELEAAEEGLGQAEKAYSISETRYRQGVGTQLETLDSQLQLRLSKTNLLQAKYNLLVAKANFDRASGKGFKQIDREKP